MTGRTCLPVLIAFCSVLWLVRSQTLDPRTERNLGVAAFKGGDCPEAVQHLERTVSADPKDATAHFYLGLTYDECMCSSPDGCDSRWSEGAIEEYKLAQALDPKHKEALKNLASLLYRLSRLDEAEGFYRQAAILDTSDPEPQYAIAALKFRRIYAGVVQERARIGIARTSPLIGFPSCWAIRAKELPDVEDGIAVLTRVVRLVDDTQSLNAEAQSFMALFYRVRAELQCGDYSAYKRDLNSSEGWWKRAGVTSRRPAANVDPRTWRWPPSPPPPPKRGTPPWN
jgi:tetratricopeptide (TPR) repeat protein